MGIQPYCALPFFVSDKEPDCLKYSRITALVIGIILIMVGLGILCGFWSVGTTLGWAFTATGLALSAIACIRCSEQSDKIFPRYDGSYNQSTKNYFTPYQTPVYGFNSEYSLPSKPQLGTSNSSESSNDSKTTSNPTRGTFSINSEAINTKNTNSKLNKAEEYLSHDDLDNAFEEAKKVSGLRDEKNAFFKRLTLSYSKIGKRKKALEVIKEISLDTKLKNKLLAELAELYFQPSSEEDLAEALGVIKEISLDTKLKDAFLKKIARSYLNSSLEIDKNKGYEVIKEIHDKETKTSLLIELANYYFETDKQKTLEIAKGMLSESRDYFYGLVAQFYLSENKQEQFQKVLAELILIFIHHKLQNTLSPAKYIEVRNKHIEVLIRTGASPEESFSAQLAKEYSNKDAVMHSFKINRPKMAINNIKILATNQCNLNMFIGL